MIPEIFHYFAPVSGYAYLGVTKLRELALRHGCRVIHAPVDIQAVFAAAGVTAPAAQSPTRKAYRAADMQRWSNRRNLSLKLNPAYWPADGAAAARYIIAADMLDQRAGDMAQAVLEAIWARDLNIADESILRALAREQGLDAAMIATLARGPKTDGLARAYTRKAMELGLFGSPTYVFGEEIFFGQDRLDFLEEAIKRTQPGLAVA